MSGGDESKQESCREEWQHTWRRWETGCKRTIREKRIFMEVLILLFPRKSTYKKVERNTAKSPVSLTSATIT